MQLLGAKRRPGRKLDIAGKPRDVVSCKTNMHKTLTYDMPANIEIAFDNPHA